MQNKSPFMMLVMAMGLLGVGSCFIELSEHVTLKDFENPNSYAPKISKSLIDLKVPTNADPLNQLLLDNLAVTGDMKKDIYAFDVGLYSDSSEHHKPLTKNDNFAIYYMRLTQVQTANGIRNINDLEPYTLTASLPIRYIMRVCVVYANQDGHFQNAEITLTTAPEFVNNLYKMEKDFYDTHAKEIEEASQKVHTFEFNQATYVSHQKQFQLDNISDILSSSLGRFNAYKDMNYSKSQYYYSVDKEGHTHKEVVDHDKVAVVDLNIVGDKDGFALIEATTLEPGEGVKDMLPVIDVKEHLWVVPDKDKDDMIAHIGKGNQDGISTGSEHDLDFHAHQWDKLSEQDVIHIVNQVSK